VFVEHLLSATRSDEHLSKHQDALFRAGHAGLSFSFLGIKRDAFKLRNWATVRSKEEDEEILLDKFEC
jgi:hypothetical protein